VLLTAAVLAPEAGLAQGPANPSTPDAGSEAHCNGEATFLLVGIPTATRYEVDLRQGTPPGSTRLRIVSFDGDSQVSFAGLCAGDYVFAYRRKGDADYSVSSVMRAKLEAGKVSRIGSRVQIYTTPAGWGTTGKKTKASDL
jgi:hypothetical protein